jgi:hypothetical protein
MDLKLCNVKVTVNSKQKWYNFEVTRIYPCFITVWLSKIFNCKMDHQQQRVCSFQSVALEPFYFCHAMSLRLNPENPDWQYSSSYT